MTSIKGVYHAGRAHSVDARPEAHRVKLFQPCVIEDRTRLEHPLKVFFLREFVRFIFANQQSFHHLGLSACELEKAERMLLSFATMKSSNLK